MVRLNEFFENTNILVTGGTGFIGKVLIEKLLRSQTNIKKIYILIRSKKGKLVDDRAKTEIFEKLIFYNLKKHNPNFMEKIALLEGDIGQAKLGLKDDDVELIKNEINIVFNAAASLNMAATFKYSAKYNIYSVLELLNLCREMKNLKSLVIVSTAYSNSNNSIIEEKIYKAPVTASFALEMCKQMDEKALLNVTDDMLNGFPNTYVLTKCIMESALPDYNDLPIVLFRPGIVICGLQEPVPSWIDNVNGPVGMTYLGELGILRTILINVRLKITFVPVDFCVNALICSAWHGIQERMCNSNQIMVYNNTYNEHQMPLKVYEEELNSTKIRLEKAIWKPTYIPAGNKFSSVILHFLLNILPAITLDRVIALTGHKFRLTRLFNEKINSALKVLSYFMTNEWTFKEDNFNKMLSSLDETEKAVYPFDMRKVTLEELMQNYLLGIKLYIAKEKMEDNYKAVKRDKILTIVHYVFLFIFWSSVLWVFFRCYKCLGI